MTSDLVSRNNIGERQYFTYEMKKLNCVFG